MSDRTHGLGHSDGSLIGEFTRRQGLILSVLLGVGFLTFRHMVEDSVARWSFIGASVILAVAWIFRPIWTKAWFWTTMVGVGVAHYAVIKAVPWPFESGTRIASALVAVDLVLVLGLVSLLARVIEGRWP
jgi:hypothetical protein